MTSVATTSGSVPATRARPDAVAYAHALLTNVGFNGTGSYASRTNATQTTTARSLATSLDRYDNNALC